MDDVASKLIKQFKKELMEEGEYSFETEIGRNFRVFVKLWEEIAEHYGEKVTEGNLRRLLLKAKSKAKSDFGQEKS